ncbi:hypothetical protein C7B61_07300 [filamentous cyanobacterium CCP1]|nr:hypothetical protein C7B76_04905 [filamentous cyanobacterium CCP2]PSB67225.1 hypothetical protein C7B61_07300 [filamentous cyanobacterium CCP1]
MLNTFYPIEAIDIASSLINSLYSLRYLIDGVTAFFTLIFSGLLVISALPFGSLVTGQVGCLSFLLICINATVQIIATGGQLTSTIQTGIFVDIVNLAFGIFVSLAIRSHIIAGVIGMMTFFAFAKGVGLPGILERCAGHCPFDALIRQLINYLG